ncbi:hypothetical protein M404DRAFT_8474 [Pisolithus tinctorius Marx 270]|uniref:Uncharacterized protein n=1 Tax=Pisolithus tinctorius Marx 270 TaxID=870435 RepID=A0A0C3PGY9_PISTI|nr:hypothetical protein M404DRAFT_8474 [Pisolithus tinctorius Marx 270]
MGSCMFDSSHPQWSRTPLPNQNSMVHYSGQFSGVATGGGIAVELKNITLNLGRWCYWLSGDVVTGNLLWISWITYFSRETNVTLLASVTATGSVAGGLQASASIGEPALAGTPIIGNANMATEAGESEGVLAVLKGKGKGRWM